MLHTANAVYACSQNSMRFATSCLLSADDFNGYHYIAVNDPLSQEEAGRNCQQLGGDLASILSEDENSFIQTLTSEEYCGDG